jgi:Rad3-related DNA helicase
MDILDYWPIPEFEPRPNQVKALRWIEEHRDYRYKLLQAPVGSGKSLIGVTYAAYEAALADRNPDIPSRLAAFYLTPQLILQKQYEDSFPKGFMATLYGKSNYKCAKIDSTCDVGSLLKNRCENCPFARAKWKAQRCNHVILNYKLALLQFYYTQTWSERSVIVHDECHGLEEYLTELSAPTITSHRCEKYNVKWKEQQTLESALEWLKEKYLPGAGKYHAKLYEELAHIIEGRDDPTKIDARKLKELNALEEHMDELQTLLYMDRGSVYQEYVLVTDETQLKFKPLSGAAIFQETIDPVADKHLFMSSTILNPTGYCRDMGINPEEAVFLDLPSDFPVENRPVYYMPQCKMNASWNSPENADGRKQMLNMVQEILEMHGTDSGIIHTGNFKIAQWLTRQLEGGVHDVYQHNPDSGDDRNTVIDAFQKTSRPSILISPSITEGLDLKHDKARFAIFAKVPFGFLGDQWIKQRMKMSQEWYQRRTLIDVIQGGGRVVRSAEDWGITYILDESWGYLYKRANKYIPEWWKDGYFIKAD